MVPVSILELITESMARENIVIATAIIEDSIDVAMASPEPELRDKLRFVLNIGTSTRKLPLVSRFWLPLIDTMGSHPTRPLKIVDDVTGTQ